MGLRKWNDNKGWSRGARGIDEEKGTEFVHRYRDKAAEMQMFERCWPAGATNFGGEANASEKNGNTDTKSWSESADYDTKSGGGDGGSPF